MRYLAGVVLLALAPTLVHGQEGRALCTAAGELATSSIDATVEQAQQANNLRMAVSLWFDVPESRRKELQGFIDKLTSHQTAEIEQTLANTRAIVSICNQR